ncbi:DUF4132 domain-containing protein [Actinocorallia populi]|uniref:DUF4132 domain-containing protein n=1 Tax=Actinocorallia populi TaxID=2079200 RepID=UPI000D097B51|nr:DUF4132 domain-containing protein [Actinocorallia populi]
MIEELAEAPGVWLPTGDGHEVVFDGERVNARPVGGRPLNHLPSKVEDTPVGRRFRWLSDDVWRHRWNCWDVVEAWMTGGHALPSALLAALWPDRYWRESLDGVFVTGPDGGRGFLRRIDAGGVHLTGTDGREVTVGWTAAVITHPVLLDDLDELRETASRLGIGQFLRQLGRDVHRRPRTLEGNAVTDYAGLEIPRLARAWQRPGRYRVVGGYVVLDLVNRGEPVQARYWIGTGRHNARTVTGHLIWVGAGERILALEEVDAVAWSEGVRMAERVHDRDRYLQEGEGEPVGRPWRPQREDVRPPGPAAALAAGLLPVAETEGVLVRPRAYPHPLLGDEPMVRLVDDGIAAALDALLASRGFGTPTVGDPVGRGVGAEPLYPLWAVVHDQKNAGLAFAAMNTLGRVEQQVRLSRHYPAHLKPSALLAEFEEIAGRLPSHHLPAFWDRAGRMVLETRNASLAARLFARARESEKAAGITLDAEPRRRVYAAFAAYGGIKPSALAAYARTLKRTDPAAAHAELSALMVRSAAAGVMPAPSLPPLLAAFAKAAGLPPAETDRPWETFSALPSAANASAAFWEAAAPALLTAANRSPEAARGLLEHLPRAAAGADGRR